MYAAIRQGKAKSGMAEELAVRVKPRSVFLTITLEHRNQMDRTELGIVANRTSHSNSWARYFPYRGLGPQTTLYCTAGCLFRLRFAEVKFPAEL